MSFIRRIGKKMIIKEWKLALILISCLVFVIFISGCIDTSTQVEIDIGQEGCQKVTSPPVGSVVTPLIEKDCKDRCQQEGYTYKQWKCSKADTIVCVCNR